MTIREATITDTDTLIQLRLLYLTEHFGDIGDTEKQIKQQLSAYIPAHLSKDFSVFLAEENGEIVACAFLVLQEKPANPRFPTGKTGLLLNVYTKPSFRRRGVADALLKAVIEEARRLNLSFIELTATEAGEKLYLNNGFQYKDTAREMMLVL